MQIKRVALFIVICYVLGFLGHLLVVKKTVYGDGIYYYSWVRSQAIDHDISFADEYKQFGVTQSPTSTNLLTNKHSIGPALLWMPSFLLTHTLVRSDGYSLPYQIAVGLTSLGFALIGLLLLYQLLRKNFGKMASLSSITAIAFATNLFFYGSLDTVNSHGVSFFAAVLFLTFLFQKRRQWFLIGLALGFLTVIRPQDIVYAILILPFLTKIKPLPFLIGFVLPLIPQLAGWQILYGKFWADPYINSYEKFNVFSPHLFGVLFSVQNGLLLWTPVVALGLVGLKRRPIMLLVFLLELFIIASWSTWWQGASYSGRMFVSILPLIAVGMANVFTYLERFRFGYRHFLYIFLLPLGSINMCLIVYFLLSH
jgi:Dolichyl-phosphate-mannose-protein mannosyltransferase